MWGLVLALGSTAWVVSCDGGPGDESPALRTDATTLERFANVKAFQQMEFSTVNDIEWVSDSTLALIDIHGGSIVVQNIYTGEEQVIGRKGEGPGELTYPIRIGVESTSSSGPALFVADSKAQRLSLFDAVNGEFRSSQQIRGMPVLIHGMRDSIAIVSVLPFAGDAGPELVAIDFVNDSLHRWFGYLEADERLAAVGSRFLAVAGNAAGPFYAASGSEYRIVGFDSTGGIVSTFGRPEVTAEFPTEADVERRRAALKDAEARTGLPVSEELLERYRSSPMPFFSLTGLATDGRGNLWVVRAPGAAEGSTLIDVFNAKGVLIQSLQVRDRVQAMDFRDSLVAFLVERATGPWADLNSVDVYRVNTAHGR